MEGILLCSSTLEQITHKLSVYLGMPYREKESLTAVIHWTFPLPRPFWMILTIKTQPNSQIQGPKINISDIWS